MADANRDATLVDDLAEEFARRLRAGERPSVDEYVRRHPQHAEALRTVLPGVVLMEQLKPKRTDVKPPASRPAPQPLPARIGEYRIVREIGRGGMGVVCEALQETLGRRVAIKLLGGHLLADAKLRERFRRESRAAARLHHTNIVPVFAVGEGGGQCYYVMQLIDGESLAEIIRRLAADRDLHLPREDAEITQPAGGRRQAAPAPTAIVRTPGSGGRLPKTPVPGVGAEDSSTGIVAAAPAGVQPAPPDTRAFWHTVARVGASVADALAYSHGRGILHRDIKPSNLLLDSRGTVWVTDFGVAKILEEANLTQSGEFAGTLKYMPPERFSGTSDARCDVYSLGITLYELLTLRPAYPETSPQHLIALIGQGTPPPPRRLNPAIPADLETVVLKAMARDPDHRYQSAAEMAEDLRRFLEDRPVLAKRSSQVRRAWRWCRRNPALAAAAAVTASLLVAITVVSLVAYARTRAASREVAAANLEIEKALAAETAQRRHAEEVSNLALDALNQTYQRFAPTRLVASAPTTGDDEMELPVQPTLPPEAVRLLEDLLRTYEQIATAGGEIPGLRARAAEANFRIGDICQRLGRSDDAIRAFRRAIALYSRPADGDDPDLNRIKVARACSELGQTLRFVQQPAEAKQMYEQAVRTLTEGPAAFTRRPECRYELARTYYRLALRDFPPPPRPHPPGEFGHGRGGPGRDHGHGHGPGPGKGPPEFPPGPPDFSHAPPKPPADPAGQRAVALLEELVREYDRVPEYLHLLACCYRDVSDGGPGGPGDTADRAIPLLRKLVAEFPQVPDYLFDLCETLGRAGPPGRFRGDGGRSVDRLREAVKLSRELVEKYPNVPAYAAAHAHHLNFLGIGLYPTKDYAEAEKLHRRALWLHARLAKLYPQVTTYAIGQSMVEHALSYDLSKRAEWKEARARLESATTRLAAILKADPSNERVQHLLGQMYRDLGRVLTGSGETALAAEAVRKADQLGPESGRGPFSHFGPGDH